MTIRSDIDIDWEASPRVITIASPSDEITIQDLVDTCRFYEQQPINMDNPHLINAAGKEFLGGTTYVGITATLQNAVLAFEARGGPSWILCTISGGNLVAVDSNGNDMDPRLPTAYVSVDRTASASATLQEQAALQYASYNGGVAVDILSSHSGTEYPIGTEQAPVNNTEDALIIAADRGFTTFYISGDITLDDGTDFDEAVFVGESKTKSIITIDANADVTNCEFYDAEVTGILDGGNVLKNCLIGNLNYVNGFIEQCVLKTGTITLGGSKEAHFLDCWSGAITEATPIIDMGGLGQALGMRNYNGGIHIKNKSGTDKIDIDMNSGQVILDNTVTNGVITLRGLGHLTDNSVGATVNSDDLLCYHTIGNAVWDHADADFLLKIIKNKKALEKTDSIWELIIYDNDDTTPILQKDLKDKDGNDITDLEAGTLAMELKTSV